MCYRRLASIGAILALRTTAPNHSSEQRNSLPAYITGPCVHFSGTLSPCPVIPNESVEKQTTLSIARAIDYLNYDVISSQKKEYG